MNKKYKNKYAFGGKVPVEVEGGEMIETPMGFEQMMVGASHGQGGINTALPEGTMVFSDRLKLGDKTIAERKAARKKTMDKLLELTSKNKTDFINKNSVKRTEQVHTFEQEKDLAYQKVVGDVIQRTGRTIQNLALGTNNLKRRVPYETERDTLKTFFDLDNVSFDTSVADLSMKELGLPKAGRIKPANITGIEDPTAMGFTTGDIVGTVGTAVGAISQMVNTISNAKATKPNVNYFEGVNQRALAANRQAKDQLGANKNVAQREIDRKLQIAGNTARARNRGGATSMNTLRSMDLATDIASDAAMTSSANELEGIFGNQIMQLFNVDSQLLSNADQLEMAGRERADLADRQDLDNMYTQFGQNLATMSESIQKMGSNINQSKSRRDFLRYLPHTNKWGIGVDPKTGQLTSNKNYDPRVPGTKEEVISTPMSFVPDEMLFYER